MRTIPQGAWDAVTQTKTVGARATFRQSLPKFYFSQITNNLNLTDWTWIDSCLTTNGMLIRAANVGNYLYTQAIAVANIHSAWPAWVNTGNPLYPGSQPSVDGNYMWYQTNDGLIRRWDLVNNVGGIARSMPGACFLAGLNDRCYAIWQRNAGAYEIVSMDGQESSCYTVYGPTSLPRLDVVSFGGKEYFYTMDRDAGRIIEVKHAGNATFGSDSYGVGKAIIPIDAIDNVYGLKLGYAGVVDGKVVVTGRLTRTSDDDALTMNVYLAGPEYFSLGRDMFISQGQVSGKMLRVGNEFVVPGHSSCGFAAATNVFGGTTNPSLELTTSDFANFTLTEAESRSTNLNLELSPGLSHAAIAPGADIKLEMAYNDNWCQLATCDLVVDQTTTEEQGVSRVVSGVGKSAKRLAQWSPDQGIYIPSQANMYDNPANMTKVIRAAGQWGRVDEEDETSPIIMKELNKEGVLYSTARASRGGAMRGKFLYPSDTYLQCYYGVVINYYRESAAEAAARLGVDVDSLTDSMYGHNGIYAQYSPTEYNGGSGIGLYLWRDSGWTKLTSASLSIPADTWHWLQIEFIEGEIRVKYRLDSNVTWSEVLAYLYASTTSPWKREALGRGAIRIVNVMPTATCYGFGANDDTIPLNNNGSFPSSGFVLVDDELVQYNGKSANTTGLPSGGIEFDGLMLQDAAFSADYSRYVMPRYSMSSTDHSYIGLAAALTGLDQHGETIWMSRCFRVADYDGATPNWWRPYNYAPGWSKYFDDSYYGQWEASTGRCAFYLDQSLLGLITIGDSCGFSDHDPLYNLLIKPALYILGRGQNDTVITSHGLTTATLYTSKSVQCAVAASFSQDEDQSMEDALMTIVRLAGGEATCKKSWLNGSWALNSNSVSLQTWLGKNFIMTFEMPGLNNGTAVGIAFRTNGVGWSSGNPYSAMGGYSLEFERSGNAYQMSLYSLAAGHVLLERVPIRPTNFNGAASPNVPVGTIKLSVQDSFFTVWLNGRWLHTFYHTQYASESCVAVVSRLAWTCSIHSSELNSLLADITVGTRGNGMSVLADLIGDRHILWRDDPDGSLHFYKEREYVDDLPDIVSARSKILTDDVVSRIRAEGIKVSERMNNMYGFGNSFATINARFANTMEDVRAEADYLLWESYKNAIAEKFSLVVHPAFQPGDISEWYEASLNWWHGFSIRSQTISIGFFGGNFVCDMQMDTVYEEY